MQASRSASAAPGSAPPRPRAFLQVGSTSRLGLPLPAVLAGRQTAAAAAPEAARPKSVILVFLTGGLSHLDTLDLKPEAPAELRGEFRPIPTAVPGVQVC